MRNGLLPRDDNELRELRIAVALLLCTCASVYLVYLCRWLEGPWFDPSGGALWRAGEFTLTLLGILVCHEFGHWRVGRGHGIRLALPWFLPAPFLVGTFGAVIRWSDRPRTRTGWLAMAAAGPIAGFAAVVVAAAISIWLGPSSPPGTLARPLLWWVLAYAITGGPPASPSPQDPIAFAAWIGALVTAINLLPVGQLDGGHVIGALFPGHARTISRVTTVVLLIAGFVWPVWAVWAAVANFLGGPAEPPRDPTPPDAASRGLAIACLIAWILCATPIPS